MAMTDPIADALVSLKNCDRAAKKECIFRPASNLLGEILKVMKTNGYIEDYRLVEDGRENQYRIQLNGLINECKAVKPRHAVKKDGFEKFEKRYLPAKDVGILIVTTPDGVLSHKQVKDKKIGGRILAFVF